MDSQTKAFLSVTLGQIPEVGSFLSGIFNIVEPDEFNENLVRQLDDIEFTLKDIENQIRQLGLSIKMSELYADENQADSNIDNWYYNHVGPWLKRNNTSNEMDGKYLSTETGSAGADILQNCTMMLDDINSAILGKLGENNNKWLQLVIDQCLGASAATRAANQVDSYVEISYKCWLKLIHIQMKGIACLRAINSDQLGQYICVVRDNIIAQGIECQNLVNQNLSNDDFTWVGTGGPDWSAACILEVSDVNNQFVSIEDSKVISGCVSVGIQFGTVSGQNQWGPEIASGMMLKDGSIKLSSSSWGDVPFGKNLNLAPTGLGNGGAFINYTMDSCVLSHGEVITGVKLVVDHTQSWAHSAEYNDAFGAVITYNKVKPDLSLDSDQTYTLNLDVAAVKKAEVQRVALGQYSSLPSRGASTPITGFGYTVFGNQLAIRLQTSIHQNAFGPVLIDAGDQVALYSPAKRGCLENNNGAPAINSGAFGSNQSFQLSGLSHPPQYGDKVTITQVGSPQVLLGSSNGQLVFGESGNVTHSHWTLVNPADVAGDYGSDPVPKVYNWSAVLFMLSGSDQGLYLKVESETLILTLGSPTENQSGKGNVARIDDSSYYWNVRPGQS